ncbi:hypothetical protein OFO29_37590, partial [Escherichia coli]|nr:hypothetical protein [Escherichia coli]
YSQVLRALLPLQTRYPAHYRHTMNVIKNDADMNVLKIPKDLCNAWYYLVVFPSVHRNCFGESKEDK